MSPLALVDIVLRRWRLVFGLPFAFLLVAVVIMLLLPPRYAAHSRFAPQQQDGRTGAFAGLAAQFGLPLDMGGGNTESVQFYAELVRSRELLEQVILTEYQLAHPAGLPAAHGTLLDLLEIKGNTRDERLQNAVTRLKGDLFVTVDPRANIVNVTTRARTAELATLINRRLLELVNDFNIERRRGYASAERAFAEERTDEALRELGGAESALERFLERNRRWRDAPELASEHGRLTRALEHRHAVYSTLLQRLEQARIDEVRNTPVVAVIEGPERSATPVRRPLRVGVLALLFGGFAGLALAFTLEYIRYERSRNPAAFVGLQAWGRRGTRDRQDVAREEPLPATVPDSSDRWP
jgi:uncharacterized protein involved in exopolysaccharide biosynthesis